MESITTQHSDYKDHKDYAKREPIKPFLAHANRLFPLAPDGHHYGTTAEQYYGKRQGLFSNIHVKSVA